MTTATISPKRHQTKTQVVCSQLASLAAELGPNGRLPTVVELRARLGVSLTTLDGALREMEKRGVIYRMHGVGVFVAPPKQRTVGVVYAVGQTYGSPFWDMLVEQMRVRAESGHERFRFYVTHRMPDQPVPLPEELIQDLNSGTLQGLIFVGDQNDSGIEWLKTQSVPMVTFATIHGKYRVGIATEALVEMGARELVRLGCQRIGLWSPFGTWFRYSNLNGDSNALDRFQGVLKEANLPFNEARIWRLRDVFDDSDSVSSFQEQGYWAVQEVYSGQSLQEAPDGLVIINDLMVRGALAGFQGMGVRVGEDVKIAAHSNKDSNVLLGYESILTRLQVDPTSIARALFERLEILMNGEPLEEGPHLIAPIIVRPEQARPFLQPLQIQTASTPLGALI